MSSDRQIYSRRVLLVAAGAALLSVSGCGRPDFERGESVAWPGSGAFGAGLDAGTVPAGGDGPPPERPPAPAPAPEPSRGSPSASGPSASGPGANPAPGPAPSAAPSPAPSPAGGPGAGRSAPPVQGASASAAAAPSATAPVPAPAPRALDQAQNRTVSELSPDRRVVAITVDDGPDPRYTPAVLALLRQYGIRATFFVIGQNAAAYPSLIRAIADGGHHLANHTWSHPELRRLSEAKVRTELQRTSELLEQATGRATTWFRAPGGDWSPVAMKVCSELGLRPMSWSVDPQDWARPGTAAITSRVLVGVRPGAIVLNHDGGGDRSQTVAALRAYLPALIDKGYAFTAPP
ncbi:polysaccharide deacetylase family protein [Kitasatospora indigofera]|uniref:polysaccharide deacetylase family protein n=1 Tax=Kitasatospora indigofera TaxID=67307 RepID=UPI0033A0F52D